MAASMPWRSLRASSCRPTRRGHIPDDMWALTFAINVTGLYLVADEAAKLLEGAGTARQPRADHLGQRGRCQEGQPGL